MKKIKFKISGMHCVSCAINIDGELEDAGVKCANTSYAKSLTEVEFDSDKLSISNIIGIIKKSGYNALREDE